MSGRYEESPAYPNHLWDTAEKRWIPKPDGGRQSDSNAANSPKKKGEKQADRLIKIALAAELFHKPDSSAYADINIDGRRETWPVRSKGFKQWLARQYYAETKGSPGAQAVQDALTVIESKARFDAPEREVCIRVAAHGDAIYIDLADAEWRCVEIGNDGWRVIGAPPVRFRRTSGMKPLPAPVAGGSIEPLRQFLNVKSENDFVLTAAWILAAMRGKGPYPILSLAGEHGAAKSTFSAILRSLVDPNTAPLRALPREDRDLFIAATNGHVLAYDNLSAIPDWIADTLCRLATGGGFATRQLYTDDDETLFDAARPIITNGIEDILTRGDLADRAIFQLLDPIPEDRRKPEAEIWTAFRREQPGILGALLDAASYGLRMLPHTRLSRLPRMADFALWVTACETALWPAGTFAAAYQGNRDEAVMATVDGSVVASAVRAFMATRTEWSGTATDLLGALTNQAGEVGGRAKEWPKTTRALSGRLRRAAPNLRRLGIDVVFNREGHDRTRTISITNINLNEVGNFASAPSAPSARPQFANNFKGMAADANADANRTADANADGADATQWQADNFASAANSLKTKGNQAVADATDGADANLHTRSKSRFRI